MFYFERAYFLSYCLMGTVFVIFFFLCSQPFSCFFSLAHNTKRAPRSIAKYLFLLLCCCRSTSSSRLQQKKKVSKTKLIEPSCCCCFSSSSYMFVCVLVITIHQQANRFILFQLNSNAQLLSMFNCIR